MGPRCGDRLPGTLLRAMRLSDEAVSPVSLSSKLAALIGAAVSLRAPTFLMHALGDNATAAFILGRHSIDIFVTGDTSH